MPLHLKATYLWHEVATSKSKQAGTDLPTKQEEASQQQENIYIYLSPSNNVLPRELFILQMNTTQAAAGYEKQETHKAPTLEYVYGNGL